MLTLDLPTEPYWLDLPRGVRVEIRPVTTSVMAAAQAAAARRLDRGDSMGPPNQAGERNPADNLPHRPGRTIRASRSVPGRYGRPACGQ